MKANMICVNADGSVDIHRNGFPVVSLVGGRAQYGKCPCTPVAGRPMPANDLATIDVSAVTAAPLIAALDTVQTEVEAVEAAKKVADAKKLLEDAGHTVS